MSLSAQIPQFQSTAGLATLPEGIIRPIFKCYKHPETLSEQGSMQRAHTAPGSSSTPPLGHTDVHSELPCFSAPEPGVTFQSRKEFQNSWDAKTWRSPVGPIWYFNPYPSLWSTLKVSKNNACTSTDTYKLVCTRLTFIHSFSLSLSLCLGCPALLVNSPNAVCLVYSIHTSALHRFKRITTYQELCISKALPYTS